jgi:AraC family transcriptional activator of pobA
MNIQLRYFKHEIPLFLTSSPCDQRVYRMIWFIKAGGKYVLDFEEAAVSDNTVLLIQPATVSYLKANKPTGTEGWALFIDWSYLESHGSNLIPVICGYQYTYQSVMRPDLAGKASQLLMLFHQELQTTGLPQQEILNAYLVLILSLFKSLLPEIPDQRKYDPRYYHFMELLNAQYKFEKGVDSYAAQLNLSARQLNRLCKEAVNYTVSQLIDMRLYLEAKRRLYYTAESIKEISFDLGFEDPSYFARFFKNQSGLSPTLYRLAGVPKVPDKVLKS